MTASSSFADMLRRHGIAEKRPRLFERLCRMNPGPINPGRTIRAYRRENRMWWVMDCLNRETFVALYGAEAYRRMPRCGFIRIGHRKWIRRYAADENLWATPDDHPLRLLPPVRGKNYAY